MATNVEEIMNPISIAYGSEQLPLRIGSLELVCFILEDRRSLFSKNGLQKALGYDGKSEDWLFDLLSSINKFYPVPGDLFEAYENPIPLEMKRPDGSSQIVSAIAPQTVLSTCRAILNAKNDGYLNVGQLKYAKAAAVIDRYFSENDVVIAIAEATGFNFTKETGKAYLQQYVLQHDSDPIYAWISVFRDEFWEKILNINGLDWPDLREKPTEVAKILNEIVFSRLSDHLSEILRTNRPKRAYRIKGIVKNNEHPELGAFLTEILSLLKVAAGNWTIFLQLLNRIYPKRDSSALKLPDTADVIATTGALDMNLKKAVEINKIYHKK